jgi:hypothetical protein
LLNYWCGVNPLAPLASYVPDDYCDKRNEKAGPQDVGEVGAKCSEESHNKDGKRYDVNDLRFTRGFIS